MRQSSIQPGTFGRRIRFTETIEREGETGHMFSLERCDNLGSDAALPAARIAFDGYRLSRLQQLVQHPISVGTFDRGAIDQAPVGGAEVPFIALPDALVGRRIAKQV